MTTKKAAQWTAFDLVAETGFEPRDLRVMSPTSYQAAPLRDIYWCRKPGSNRYRRLVPRDFKSRASANFAIPALWLPSVACSNIITHCERFVNTFFEKSFNFFGKFENGIFIDIRIVMGYNNIKENYF